MLSKGGLFLDWLSGASSTIEYGNRNQKAPKDVAVIREKTNTLSITLEKGLE